MLLMSVHSVSKYFGPDPVLDAVPFHLQGGERVGLVGPNGAGTATLMKILAGEETADGGTMEHPLAIRIGYLEQQPKIEQAKKIEQHEIEQHDAYQVDRRIDQVLNGLGFSAALFEQSVTQLNRVQQNRVLEEAAEWYERSRCDLTPCGSICPTIFGSSS